MKLCCQSNRESTYEPGGGFEEARLLCVSKREWGGGGEGKAGTLVFGGFDPECEPGLQPEGDNPSTMIHDGERALDRYVL